MTYIESMLSFFPHKQAFEHKDVYYLLIAYESIVSMKDKDNTSKLEWNDELWIRYFEELKEKHDFE